MKELLRVEGLKVFAGGEALVRLKSLRVDDGEVVLITGPSGSGKTSLLRCLVGVHELAGLNYSGIISLGVDRSELSYIPQEPWYGLITPYPILELMGFSGLSEGSIRAYAEALNVGHVLESNSIDLSAGEIQRILFLEALLSESKLILMDEVTAYLDEGSRNQLVSVIEGLRSNYGISFMVVDHDIDLWKDCVDKVVYVSGGEAVTYSNVDDLPTTGLTSKVMEEVRALASEVRNYSNGELLLKAINVWFKYPDSRDYVIKGVDLELSGGDLLIIQGPSGKGKSTLLKIISGIHKPSRGKILRYYKYLQYVPENPLIYLSEPTPRDELRGDLEIAKEAYLSHVLDTPITRLSSGERRRLAIASAITRGADLVVLDEPSVGLDPENLVRVLRLLTKAISRGVGLIVATHSRLLTYIGSKIITL